VNVARPPSVLFGLVIFWCTPALGGIRSIQNPNESNQYQPPRNIFVLVIGINQYQNQIQNGVRPSGGFPEFHGPEAAALDARRISETMKSKFPHSSVETVVLADSAATKSAIAESVGHFASRSSAADMFVFSFSGATYSDQKPPSGELYLVPYGAEVSA
jgi:hypothetical protein